MRIMNEEIVRALKSLANSVKQAVSALKLYYEKLEAQERQQRAVSLRNQILMDAQQKYPVVIDTVLVTVQSYSDLGLSVPGVSTQLSSPNNVCIAKNGQQVFRVIVKRRYPDEHYTRNWKIDLQDALNDTAYFRQFPLLRIVDLRALGDHRWGVHLIARN